ncbi:MAG: TylF/MycF/NovP-related O-methyltransferase [Paracoccaceae bacterium]|nr:TylF/MycF/NovP-related O-methyltransferase [Paracoccaceae bacterium]
MSDTASATKADTFEEILKELKKLNKSIENQTLMPSTPLILKRLAAEDSARYIYENFPNVQVFIYRHETVAYAAKAAQNEGIFLEFGVDQGATINQIAKLRPERRVFGFDSFRGLPEDWGGTSLVAGRFDRGGAMPAVPGNVKLIAGWFNETVPVWKKTNTDPIAFCHVDCDLYSSTVTIFTELEDRFRPGTILLFDEYFGYADWRGGEHKAFLEMIARTGFSYKALAVSHMGFVVELGEKATRG